jgi:uncharacterized protein (TIRG00374 family)
MARTGSESLDATPGPHPEPIEVDPRAGHLGGRLRWIATGLLLALLAWAVDLRVMVELARRIDPWLAAAAALVVLLDRALMAAKWLPLLRVQLPTAGFAEAFHGYQLSTLASTLLPLTASGELTRAVALGRRRGAIVEVGASMVIERLLGLVGMGVASLVVLVVACTQSRIPAPIPPLAAAAAALGFSPVLLPWAARLTAPLLRRASGRVGRRIRGLTARAAAAWALYRGRRGTLWAVAILSALEQFLPIVWFWLLALALGAGIPLLTIFIATPLILFAGRVLHIIGVFGAPEGAMVLLLSLFGVPASVGLALGLANVAVNVLVASPAALRSIDRVWGEPVRHA